MITIKNDIKEKKKQRKKYLTPCAAVLLICSLAAAQESGHRRMQEAMPGRQGLRRQRQEQRKM